MIRDFPFRLWMICAVCCLSSISALAQLSSDYVPEPGKFPPSEVGVLISGELVSIDHVNRRGAIRLDGDGVDDRYHRAPSHRFALLPYATICYHGAPAELRDVPLGTHVRGRFCLPPAGDTSVPQSAKNSEHYVPKQNHVILLEDDFSYHQRQGRAWKVAAVDVPKGKLKATLVGESLTDEMKREQTFDVDATTRIWKGREVAHLSDLAPDTIVQFNFTWAPDWVNGQLHISDAWLDQESRELAAAQQRAIHLRYERIHGLPAWIDHVEHEPNGRGVVTVTLFGGRDASLYDLFQANRGTRVAAAEPTLRTWWQEHDYKHCRITKREQAENPPQGSSGIQLQLRCQELLEGFRPGRIVRLCFEEWPRIKLPPEERVQDLNDR